MAPLVRSNAGFHILKLIERENSAEATYTQQRSRHILLRSNPKESTQAQVARLAEIRKEIVSEGASFAQMARQHSQDGSAANGGDLGWASPGQFVPEFERALMALQAGEISQPIVSRFGVHLIQLIERREVKLTDAQKREAARSVLRERRFESTYERLGARAACRSLGWKCAMRPDPRSKPARPGGKRAVKGAAEHRPQALWSEFSG